MVGLALNFVIRKGEGHQARWVGAGSGGISAIIRAGKKPMPRSRMSIKENVVGLSPPNRYR